MRLIKYVVTFALGALMFSAVLLKKNEIMESARETFRTQAQMDAKRVATKFSTVQNSVYQGIRAIARLPGVRDIPRHIHADEFEPTARQSVQELYNNLAQSIAISEIYIVPLDMQPDEIDSVTGKLQEPITTFDKLIIGQNADITWGVDAEDIEEIEIHEYRLMRKQLDRMLVDCPQLGYVNGLDYPLYSGKGVVTCDNSYYSPTNPDDDDRTGYVFSTPFYGYDGKLKGCISSVILSNVFRKALPSGNYALIAPAYDIFISADAKWQVTSSLATANESIPDSSLIYSAVIPLDSPDEFGGWALWVGVPDEVFVQSDAMQSAELFFQVATGATLMLTIAALLLIYTQDKKRKALDEHNRTLQKHIDEQTKELRRRHADLQAVFSAATDTIIISTDYDGSVLMANEGSRRMLGYSPDEIEGGFHVSKIFEKEHLAITLHNVDISNQSILFDALVSLARVGIADRKERILDCADGNQLTADLTISPIYDSETQESMIKGFLFYGVDISEAKQREQMILEAGRTAAEAQAQALKMAKESEKQRSQLEEAIAQVELADMELRVSQQRIEEVTSTINEAIWSMDPETQEFTYLSEGCETIFGFPPGDYLDRPDLLEQAIHFDDKRIYLENLNGLGLGQRVDFDFRITHANGNTKWVKAVASPIEFSNNRATRVTGSFSDITELREATGALQQSEARVRAILENVIDGIITVDSSGRIRMSNPAMTELFGYSSEELLNTHISNLISSESLGHLDIDTPDFMRKALERFAPQDDCALVATSSEGRRIPVEITFSEFHLAEQHFFIAVVRDITERNAQQAFLMQAEKNTAISALAAGVAHEFKNCLGGILGNATLALDYPAEEKLVKESLDEIVAISEKANNIALSLLSYSQSGETEDALSSVHSAIQEAKILLENECRERNVRLRIDIDEQLCVAIDPTNFQQTIINIILNAIQSFESGGVVQIRGFKEHESGVIEVRDGGCGMDPEEIKRAFDPFYSSKGVWGSDASPGQGLGLTTAKNTIEKCGGSIELRSKKGSGATVEIRLPLASMSGVSDSSARYQSVENMPITLLHKFTDASVGDVVSGLDSLGVDWRSVIGRDDLEDALSEDVGIVILDGMAPFKIEFVQMFETVRETHPDIRIVVVVDAVYDYYIAEFVKSADFVLHRPISSSGLSLALNLVPPDTAVSGAPIASNK